MEQLITTSNPAYLELKGSDWTVDCPHSDNVTGIKSQH